MKALSRFFALVFLTVLLYVIYGEVAGRYFFKVAFEPADKVAAQAALSALGRGTVSETEALYGMQHVYVASDSLRLHGYYMRNASDSARTVLLLHGYKDNALGMMSYADRYLAAGYHVLLPDLRAHGLSEGDLVGFGWNDRQDVYRWIDWLIKRDSATRIVLHGLSMGAAAVMMVSDSLPETVVACVEDAGYTSVYDEFDFQIRNIRPHSYAVLKEYVLRQAGRRAKRLAGFDFREASALEKVKKASIPMLFVHGDADDFVPFDMVLQLYNAKKGAKDLLIIQGAGHFNLLNRDSALYARRWSEFLARYVP